VVVAARGPAAGATIETLERNAKGAFFVAQINRPDGEVVTRPPLDQAIEVGDSLLVVGRSRAISAFFAAPPERSKVGRTIY
jgi:Trk K+ transport system NAD-binding subunit